MVCCLLGTACAVAADVSDVTSRSFKDEGVKEIIFSTFNGPIEVMGHSGNNIEIQVMRQVRSFHETLALYLLDQAYIHIQESTGRIELQVELPRFRLFSSVKTQIRALIPSTWEGRLTLKTSNGAIDVSGLRGTGNIRTSNGPVNIVEWEGSLIVNTSNGAIEADKVTLTRRSSFTTSNGTITLGIADLAGSLSLRSSNGTLRLNVPHGFKANIEAKTSNGTIVMKEQNREQTVKDTLYTPINGGGPMVDLRTSNGGIIIDVAPAVSNNTTLKKSRR